MSKQEEIDEVTEGSANINEDSSEIVDAKDSSKKEISTKDDSSTHSEEFKGVSSNSELETSTKPNNSSTLLNIENMTLLNQMLSPNFNYLDEDAMVMAIDKTSARDSALRDYYNKHYKNKRYSSHPPNSRRRRREVSSQSTSNLFNVDRSLSYPFYLSSSSSSSCSWSWEEESDIDEDSDREQNLNGDNNKKDQHSSSSKVNLYESKKSRHAETNIKSSQNLIGTPKLIVSSEGVPKTEKLEKSPNHVTSYLLTSKYDNSGGEREDDGKDTPQRMKKRRRSTQRLTRRMVKDRKVRKKEVKEARDLMGLVALVLAAKEIEEESKDNSSHNVKNTRRRRNAPRRLSRRTQTSKTPSITTLVNKPRQLDNKSPISKSTYSIKKKPKKEKIKQTLPVKENKALKRKHDCNEKSEQLSSDSNESKSCSPKQKKKLKQPLEKIKNSSQYNLLYAELPSTFFKTLGHLRKSDSKLEKVDFSSKRSIDDELSPNKSKVVTLVRIIVNNESFQYDLCNFPNDNERIKENRKTGASNENSRKNEANIIYSSKHIPESFSSSNNMENFRSPKVDIAEEAPPNIRNKNSISVSSGTALRSFPSNNSMELEQSDSDDSYATALFSHLSQDNSVKQPISLSLLDWRRRRHWIPTTPSSNTLIAGNMGGNNSILDLNTPLSTRQTMSSPPTELTSVSSIDFGDKVLSSKLQTIYSDDSDAPKSYSLLLPQRRHKDSNYSNWCRQLLHCLSGSGRSNAQHEFFYSDIDRAWYNFDEYKVDIVKLGVPPHARLTRKEWSLIRRKIHGRPRRFSQRFIKSQLDKLEQYRDCVRNIQFRDGSEAVPNFPYEVPAPIKIGAHVTAYNKKMRLLHRGIVLTSDPIGKRYMIQFERPELGCEFCPDTEIASHGMPSLVRACTEVSFDSSYLGGFRSSHNAIGSLPYGTTYGPLRGYDHNQNQLNQNYQELKKQKGIARALDSELVEANESELNNDHSEDGKDILIDSDTLGILSLPDRCKRAHLDDSETDNSSRIDTATERECLIRLIGMIDAMTDRKAQIINALDSCYDTIQTKKENQGVNKDIINSIHEVEVSDYLKEHHAWLHANLETTNESLYAALVHLQVMYGKAYANRSLNNVKISSNRLPSKETDDDEGFDPNPIGWINAVTKQGLDIGRSISSHRKQVEQDNLDEIRILRYLDKRLASSTTLVLSTLLFRDHYSNKDPSPIRTQNDKPEHWNSFQHKRKLACSSSIGRVLDETLLQLAPSEPLWDCISKPESARIKGYSELREALRIFHAELTANWKEIVV